MTKSERGRPSSDRGTRPVLRLVAATTLTLALSLSATPGAVADKPDRPIPTKSEIDAAKERVAETERSVGAIQASLLLANQRLEAAAVEAEVASEAYNGAMWRLDVARRELATARADAAAARRTLAKQRASIGVLVAASYQHAGQLTAITAMMGADGPEGVLDQYASFRGASTSLQADYDRFAASDAMAQVFEDRASAAARTQQRLAVAAEAAKERATEAATAAQAAAGEIATEKDRLIRELARAQDISVALARGRQTALEERARQRAAERARVEAEAEALRQAEEQARQRAEARAAARAEQARAEVEAQSRAEERRRARAEARERAREQARDRAGAEASQRRRDRQDRTPEPTVTRDEPKPTPVAPEPASPQPAPAPPPPPKAPSGSSGADAAIAFAKAQAGEPYVWGAAGPDSWDCSGLMLEAWAQAGVYLPHYSVAQYNTGTPISSGDLRPGDLVFWGTTDDPVSIHHVAMYIGDGMIVHAPRTGRPVVVESMYYWIPPNFFARV